MTSQSTLGDDPGIAEELADSQRSISIAEFFEKNKHMLGFDSPARGLVTAVKEGVDNSLDAAEEAGILPDIYVEIEDVGDYYKLVIEDNGPGITKEQLPKVFGKLLYGSRFHKREQSLLPDQQVLIKRNGTVELIDIGTLCDAYLPQPDGAGTVRIDDAIEAPCFNRDTGELSWEPVTHAIRHETDHDTYRIETATGREIAVTGNHSLFTLDADGEITEVNGRDLRSGDAIIAPETIPTPEPIEDVNLLSMVPRSALSGTGWYVGDLPQDLIEELLARAEPILAQDRYRIDGVEVPAGPLADGYLPATAVVNLDLTDAAATGALYPARDARVSLSPIQSVNSTFVSALARAVASAIESPAVSSAEQRKQATVGQAAGDRFLAQSALELTDVLGMAVAAADGLPSICFRLPAEHRRTFLQTLHDRCGEPTAAFPAVTTSDRSLARDLSYLWSMAGVTASWDQLQTDGNQTYTIAPPDSPFDDTDTQTLPASIVDPLVQQSDRPEWVPATVPGVLHAAGLGEDLSTAARHATYMEAWERSDESPSMAPPQQLQTAGLVQDTGTPTDALRDLYQQAQRIAAFGQSDLQLLAVTEIEPVDAPEYVYDISVPGRGADENFVAGNCGALAVKNSRGQQGIGISAAVLYAQLTSGKPARITSRPKGSSEAQYFELIIDTDSNDPEIRTDETTTWDRPHGTRIELEMEANMRARQQLHEYIRNTAVVNPHARIELREPGLDEPLKFERGTDQLPAETEEIRPHPHGVELGTLLKMIEATDSHSVSGFLQSEFTRVGRKTAESIIDAFRDRYYGRALTWSTPGAHESIDLVAVVRDATANKSADATTGFAEQIATAVADHERLAHHELQDIVARAATSVEETYDTTFGETVRERATAAVWQALTGDGEDSRRRTDCYRLIDDATSTRKDDATIDGLARRLAEKIATETGPTDRITTDQLRELIDRAASMTEEREDATVGETARENIHDAIWDITRSVPDDPPRIRSLRGDRDAVSDLLEGMRATSVLSPPTSCLAPITEELIEAGLRKEFNADFYAAATRDAEVHGGDPFIVEAGIAYGGELEDGTVDVLRFANRVPLVYQRGACATTDVIKSIGWRNYKLDQPGGSGLPKGPAVIMIHVASTNVPFTSESKDAIANVPEIEDEIELAVREAARELKSYLKKKRSIQQRQKKQDTLADILPEMAQKVAEVTGRDEPEYGDALAKIMNNVLVERHVTADGDDATVALTVENHTSRNESLDITEILDAEPHDLPDDATAVEVDGEWFINWSTEVSADGEARLEYRAPRDASFDLSIDGIETAKLTVTETASGDSQ